MDIFEATEKIVPIIDENFLFDNTILYGPSQTGRHMGNCLNLAVETSRLLENLGMSAALVGTGYTPQSKVTHVINGGTDEYGRPWILDISRRILRPVFSGSCSDQKIYYANDRIVDSDGHFEWVLEVPINKDQIAEMQKWFKKITDTCYFYPIKQGNSPLPVYIEINRNGYLITTGKHFSLEGNFINGTDDRPFLQLVEIANKALRAHCPAIAKRIDMERFRQDVQGFLEYSNKDKSK